MTTTFKLNTGAQIPAVGFGTWQDADSQEAAVLEALKAGYKHIDTARIYGTEPAVGSGIKKSGIPREQIFLTTKLWNNAHHPDDVEPALDASLKDLGTDYVDLYLIHWPVAFGRGDEVFPKDSNGKTKTEKIDYVDTYKALEKVYKKGKAKAIGISNFSRAELERLLKETEVVPAVHQLESHPWLQQRDFSEFHRQKGIHITHYSPFGNQNEIYGSNVGKLIDDPVLNEIGKKYNKSGAQVALAWGIAEGHSVIPKSKTPARIAQNLQGDFKLDDEDVKKVQSIDKKLRFNDSSADFGYEFFTDLDDKKA
ncbi:hypothetical protein SLS55_004493 [Diplodia seriata]|uniref:NADP-dependent oxidoreductase domain-containing protein n=1 Tax=Diplodia seriata TaxID=420778 RepID=A0ABR3CJJ5_9PEZI